MNFRVEINADGADLRGVSGEISGTLAERERQLRDLFRLAEAAALEHSLRLDQPEVPRPQCCGRPMNKKRLRSRQLLTPAGVVTWDRRVYQCPQCGRQLIPLDDLLGVPRGQLSPRLANLGMDFVQVESYEQAVEKLRRQHGVSVATRSLVNLAGQIGPPAQAFLRDHKPRDWPSGPIDRLYVGCDGVMTCTNEVGEDGRLKWREVKVGCCFWYDVSGHTHKRIFGRIEVAEDFGVTLRRWADQCGLASAKEVVFIGDGAEWIWNIANRHFNDKRTTWVLDWYHLVEHLWEAAGVLHPDDRAGQVAQVAEWKRILRYDGGVRLWRRLQQMQAIVEEGTCGREAIESLLGYLKPRLDQTDYPTYRQRGLAIGSGVVESAGKQLVVQRAKGPGMHWTAEGLEVVLALRSISLNRDWDAFWKTNPQRAAA